MATAKTGQRSASNAADGSPIDLLVEAVNRQTTMIEALLAKMDLDAGITDTNYASTIGEGHEITLRP